MLQSSVRHRKVSDIYCRVDSTSCLKLTRAVRNRCKKYEHLGSDVDHSQPLFTTELPKFEGWAPAWSPSQSAPAAESAQRINVESGLDLSPPSVPKTSFSDAREHALEQCYITHPGSLTCSSASVTCDERSGTIMLSLKASVRSTEGKKANRLELEELGWLALKLAAEERAAALNQQMILPCEHDERHRQVLNMLKNGVVLDATKSVNSFGHVSYVVTLEDQVSKQRCQALFKPAIEGDGEGWHRVPIEAAAYHLNLLLGMDCVPPAVFRSACDVDWQHFDRGGAFIYWCSAATGLSKVPPREWGCHPDVMLSDTRILDVLIQNSDRHEGHFMWAEHWAKGAYKAGRVSHDAWRGRMHPILIDQAAGFRPEAFVSLEHENAFGSGPTNTISSKTYMRLRFLDLPAVTAALGEYISPEEIRSLLRRKDEILHHFDTLVGTKGYHQVVLE
ncbi:hypothetical protein CEUSTIGMA_g3396.t1 [Chlamydomonas eustigma]|uniref:PI3K/PI4K catalytic domain-containing protein n=1 Tax=Chlamydomonas eustigma TaxID=1157962 RepID=A0A250WYN2_9CHLO|nr:hypothetical protein CEUSTIGMA_g3396.t1 [Chlamydomonas eustigma]|eukprot:GAX75953.1 hypothetical protein CEUSTIGMA_g3396.t1 [Chlamydomonas eustigma]